MRGGRPWWLAIAFVIGLQLALVQPARACSCMEPGGMADYRGDSNTAVFTAIVQPRDARGYPVIVTRWFQGGPFEAQVWLDAAAFTGDGASCGIAPLPIATEWIFVAYRIEGRQELGTGLCSPHGALTGPDAGVGQGMLADARRTFGAGFGFGADPPATPAPTDPTAVDPAFPSPAILLIGLVAGLGFAAGLVFILARRRVDPD